MPNAWWARKRREEKRALEELRYRELQRFMMGTSASSSGGSQDRHPLWLASQMMMESPASLYPTPSSSSLGLMRGLPPRPPAPSHRIIDVNSHEEMFQHLKNIEFPKNRNHPYPIDKNGTFIMFSMPKEPQDRSPSTPVSAEKIPQGATEGSTGDAGERSQGAGNERGSERD